MDIPCLWIRRINIVRITILPKVIYRFNAIPVQLSMAFSQTEQKILQFVWKHKRPWKAKAILRKNNGARGIRSSRFRLSYKAIVIETAWHWIKNRNIDQWNKIESQEINLGTHSHLIYDKGDKTIQRRKDSLSNSGAGKTEQLHAEEWNFNIL